MNLNKKVLTYFALFVLFLCYNSRISGQNRRITRAMLFNCPHASIDETLEIILRYGFDGDSVLYDYPPMNIVKKHKIAKLYVIENLLPIDSSRLDTFSCQIFDTLGRCTTFVFRGDFESYIYDSLHRVIDARIVSKTDPENVFYMGKILYNSYNQFFCYDIKQCGTALYYVDSLQAIKNLDRSYIQKDSLSLDDYIVNEFENASSTKQMYYHKDTLRYVSDLIINSNTIYPFEYYNRIYQYHKDTIFVTETSNKFEFMRLIWVKNKYLRSIHAGINADSIVKTLTYQDGRIDEYKIESFKTKKVYNAFKITYNEMGLRTCIDFFEEDKKIYQKLYSYEMR